MANLIATNFGEFSAIGDFWDSWGGSSIGFGAYSAWWPNGLGRLTQVWDYYLQKYLAPGNSEVYLHALMNHGGTQQIVLWKFLEGATLHGTLYWNADGTFTFTYGASGTTTSTLRVSRTGAPVIDVQVHFKVDDTTGVAQVKINDVLFIDVSGVDTRNGGAAGTITILQIFQSNGNTLSMTDFIVNDASGSYCNSWPGMVRVVNGVPSADGASGVQFTPLSGANYTNVDDALPGLHDSDTSYNEDSVAGHKDWFAFPSSMFTGMTMASISLVRHKYVCKAPDAGAHTARGNCKSGGNITNGATISVGSGYQRFEDPFYLDPATSAAWASFAAIYGAEFGYEMVS